MIFFKIEVFFLQCKTIIIYKTTKNEYKKCYIKTNKAEQITKTKKLKMINKNQKSWHLENKITDTKKLQK